MQFGLYIASFGASSRNWVFIIITYRVTLNVCRYSMWAEALFNCKSKQTSWSINSTVNGSMLEIF